MQQRDLFFLFLGFTLGGIIGFGVGFSTIPKPVQQHMAEAVHPTASQETQKSTEELAEEKLKQLKADLSKKPGDYGLLIQIGNVYFETQQWTLAAEFYQKALAIQAQAPDVITNLGVAQRQMGKMEEALLLFQKARSLAPSHWQPLYNLALTKIAMGKETAEIRTHYQELIKLRSEIQIPLGFAMQYYSAEKWTESLYYFENAMKLDSNNWAVLTHMAKAYESDKQLHKAADIYEKMMQFLPEGHKNDKILEKIKQLRATPSDPRK